MMWVWVLLGLYGVPWGLSLTGIPCLTDWTLLFWPWYLVKLRLYCLLVAPGPYFPLRLRLKLLFGIVLRFALTPLWWGLWMVDELVYGAYRGADLRDTVWVVSTPRTGSTNTTEAILHNERDFVSPRMIETFMPFVCVNRVVDLFEWTGKRLGFDAVAVLTRLAMSASKVNEDAIDHHPMNLYTSSQPEHVHMLWLSLSAVGQFNFPHPYHWERANLGTVLPRDVFLGAWDRLRHATMQKVLYRRGRGRRMVFKTHTTEDCFWLAERYPESVFVIGNRRPSHQLPSVLGLANSFQMSMSGTSCLSKEWVDARYRYLGKNWEEEITFLDDNDRVPAARKLHVRFQDFVKDPESVLRRFYSLIHMDPSQDETLTTAIANYVEEHRRYKRDRKYTNPSLDPFGLIAEDVDREYAHYIDRFQL
mmetsp:Transcript_27837/g.77870  ORF Transcript_27837/g.77870 Transcript_27837/m.77870 type:complete len:419 (-) Transcript_27837:174-1430(-)